MKRLLAIATLLIVTVSLGFAQSPFRDKPVETTREYLKNPPIVQGFQGLLDPSRITMHQQIGMSYSSYGGSGYTQGYYLNTLSYRFNAPVLLNIHTGVTNNPFSTENSPGSTSFGPVLGNAEFFGGADLNWKPANNVFVQFSFYKVPGSLFYNNLFNYTNPYYRSLGAFDLSPYGYNDPCYFR